MNSVTHFPMSLRDQSPACADIHRMTDRSKVALSISQMLLALHCREEGARPIRLCDMAPKDSARFRAAGEQIVQAVLRPGLERIATMVVADLICRGEYGQADELSIVSDASPQRAAYFFKLAETVIRGYKQTLVFESPDAAYDRRLDDRLQGLEMDGLVEGGRS